MDTESTIINNWNQITARELFVHVFGTFRQ